MPLLLGAVMPCSLLRFVFGVVRGVGCGCLFFVVSLLVFRFGTDTTL